MLELTGKMRYLTPETILEPSASVVAIVVAVLVAVDDVDHDHRSFASVRLWFFSPFPIGSMKTLICA